MRRSAAALGLAVAVAAGGQAAAQHWSECEDWALVAGDEPGTVRSLSAVAEIPVSQHLNGGVRLEGLFTHGEFVRWPEGGDRTPIRVALWDFHELGPYAIFSAEIGRSFDFRSARLDGIAAASGQFSRTHLEELVGKGVVDLMPMEEELRCPTTPLGRGGGAAGEGGGSFEDIVRDPEDGPGGGSIAERLGALDPEPDPTPAPEGRGPEPTEPPAAADRVCAFPDLEPLAAAPGPVPEFGLAGVVSGRTPVPVLVFDAFLKDVRPLGRSADLRAEAERLAFYEPHLPSGFDPAVGPVPVAFEGLAEAPLTQAAAGPAAAPGDLYPYRVIVVGGAREAALSGLDALDPLLRAAGSGYRLEIEWREFGSDGRFGTEGLTFGSFAELVAHAGALAEGAEYLQLDERAFEAVLGNIEAAVERHPAARIDQVILLRTGGGLANSVPVTFSRFMARMGEQPKLRGPDGGRTRWLTVISAFAGDFSEYYLKQPLTAEHSGAGTLIVRDGSGERDPPRLLDVPHNLAASIEAGALAAARAAGMETAAAATASGVPELRPDETLTVARGDAFSRSGIVVARALLTPLADAMIETAGTLSAAAGPGELRRALRDLAGDRAPRVSPDRLDLAQAIRLHGDARALRAFRFPPTAPEPFRARLGALADDDRAEMVRGLYALVQTVSRARRAMGGRAAAGCSHVFLAETLLWPGGHD